MIRVEDLKKLFAENDIVAFPVKNEVKSINLDLDIDGFLKFLKHHNVNTAYYMYSYYDVNDFLITDEMVTNLDISLKNKSKTLNKIEKYNENVYNFDFENPYTLLLFTIIDHIVYSAEIVDEWIEETDIGNPELSLDMIINPPTSKDSEKIMADFIKREEEKKEKNLLDAKKELCKFVISDPKFTMCTNQNLRRIYAKELFSRKSDLTKILFTHCEYENVTEAFNFVDLIWKLMKQDFKDVDEIVKFL